MEFIESIWKYTVVSAPYLMLGFLVAGLMKALLPDKKVKQWLGGKNIWAVIKASIIGIPLPLCSCSVIPSAVSLKKSGASNAATSSFLISTPESGVDSISMTYALMDMPMTIMRPIAAFTTAIFAGVLQFIFNNEEYEDDGCGGEVKSCCGSKKKEIPECCSKRSGKTLFIHKLGHGIKYAYLDLMEDLSFWLTIGLVAGALIDFVIPAEFFVGLNGFWGRILILAIGVPLYICASASTPIAASLVMKGLSPGAAILLLLVGPATNISNILVLQKYIGKKGIAINIFSICFVAFLMSYLIDYIYTTLKLPINFKLAEYEHGGQNNLFFTFLTIVFLVLLIRGIYLSKIKPIIKK